MRCDSTLRTQSVQRASKYGCGLGCSYTGVDNRYVWSTCLPRLNPCTGHGVVWSPGCDVSGVSNPEIHAFAFSKSYRYGTGTGLHPPPTPGTSTVILENLPLHPPPLYPARSASPAGLSIPVPVFYNYIQTLIRKESSCAECALAQSLVDSHRHIAARFAGRRGQDERRVDGRQRRQA